jgi:hypothetical protein
MNPVRTSLLMAITGWAAGLILFALIQWPGDTAFHAAIQQATPFTCGLLLPLFWVAGIIIGMNNAMTLARANNHVPRASLAGLLLCLLGLATTLIYMLLTLLAT